jgi:uncharacterized protein with FMN-binding domain
MYPKRGAFAVFLTAIALMALLSYKTPDLMPPGDPGAIVEAQDLPSSLVALADPSDSAESLPSDGSGTSPSDSAGQTETSNPSVPGQPPTPGSTIRIGQPPTPGQPPAPGQPPVMGQPPTARPPTPAPPKAFTGTVTGVVSYSEFGPTQVRVSYSNGKIVDVVALQTPTSDSHSKQLAARAVPILRSEALAAQSAKIHTVSGATYTSKAYIASLQSAIDKAPV